MSAGATPIRLKLQVNTSGAWRNVIEFDRDDDMACARVLTGGALLAEASGPRTTLRIVSTDAVPAVFSHWDARKGWRGKVRWPAGPMHKPNPNEGKPTS